MDTRKGHRYFHLLANGKRTGIFTKTSHGSRKYKALASPLLSEMKKQLKLDNSTQLRELVDCSLSQDDYLDILREKGIKLE